MSGSNLIQNISDYLENRQKSNNFGVCKRCSKNVYWAKTKIASHIRSGHCEGASEAEVSRFKYIFSLQQELVYEKPKNSTRKRSVGNSTRIANNSNKATENGEKSEQLSANNVFIKQEPKDDGMFRVKRKKQDSENEDTEGDDFFGDNNDSDDTTNKLEIASDNGKEFMFFSNDPIQDRQPKKSVIAGSSKEDKFIATIYPQFKGKSKMELIDEIFDHKRRVELLEIKVRKYEDTISKLL